MTMPQFLTPGNVDEHISSIVELACNRYAAFKKEATRNGPIDLVPLLCFVGATKAAFVMPKGGDMDPAEKIPDMVNVGMSEAGTPPVAIIFIAEALTWIGEEDEEGPPDDVDLTELLGVDPRVSEALLSQTVWYSGSLGLMFHVSTLPFHYGDGEIQFQDALEGNGRIADIPPEVDAQTAQILRQLAQPFQGATN